MIRVTFTAVPRRTAVLAAKATVLAGLAGPAGAVAVGLSLLAGRLILPGSGIGPAHGYPALSLADGTVLRAAFGSVLYLFPIIAPVLGPDRGRHVQQIGPMTAGLTIQATVNLRTLPITPWAGLGVLAAWSAAALLAAALLLRLRDA